VERERGLTLLEEAGGSVKLALLMAAAALSVDQAKALLQQHNQQLRPPWPPAALSWRKPDRTVPSRWR